MAYFRFDFSLLFRKPPPMHPFISLARLPHSVTIACLLVALSATHADGEQTNSGLSAAPFGPNFSRTYDVRQTVMVREIPPGTRQVRLWVSIPAEDPAQRVLNLNVVSAPGPWRLVREKDYGNQFLFVEINKPGLETVTNVLEFSLVRQAVFHALDPRGTDALAPGQAQLFQDHLRTDERHMEVTPAIRKLAESICGPEENLVVQARQLLEYVADHTEHYSKNPKKPNCGVGDAANCLSAGGGCCTDLHSLFIALARARGIPARLQMGYRLQAKNEGKEADPGYRCWPEYFVPEYGWIPADIVEAAADDPKTRARWFSGLNEWRVRLNTGRAFELTPRQQGPPVNTMIIGYAEIDGIPARVLPESEKLPQLTRTIRFTERKLRKPGSRLATGF
jgi:hypothetical protein